MTKAEFIKKLMEIEKKYEPNNWVADIFIEKCEEVIKNGKEKENTENRND